MIVWSPVDLSAAEVDRMVKIPQDGVEYVLAATDGSCLDPGDEDLRRAGLGVFWRSECRANMRSPLGGVVQSNQRAEAVAILVAVRQAVHSGLQLMIWSDSRYCVDLVELLLSPQGVSNDTISASWDHADVWTLTNDRLTELPVSAEGRPMLAIKWVKAHTDYEDVLFGRVDWLHWYMNKEADRLAGEGARMHTMNDAFREQHHKILRLTALTHVMMIKVLMARKRLAPVAETLRRSDEEADLVDPSADVLLPDGARGAAQMDGMQAASPIVPPLVVPTPALPALPPPPPPRRGGAQFSPTRSNKSVPLLSGFSRGRGARPDPDGSERRRLFPNFAWDPPSHGTRHQWGSPPKLLGMAKSRNTVDNRSTVWHWPREYFAAACWYLSHLEWDTADGSAGTITSGAQVSTPFVVLAVDFMACTGIHQIAGSRNTTASWAKDKVNVNYTNLAKIGDAVAAIFRRAAALCQCEPFPVKPRTAVHALRALDLAPVPGVPARAKLMQHSFVADVLFHRAVLWNRSRPSSSSRAGCLDLELPPPWGWPARLWRPAFQADGSINVDIGREPEPEPGRAPPESPLRGEKRRRHGWMSHKVRARNDRWEQHNARARSHGLHVVGPLPDPDMELSNTERGALAVSCERCLRAVKAKRLDDFYKEKCPGEPPVPKAAGRLLPATAADLLAEARRQRHNATAEERGLHRMRPPPERREGQAHDCQLIGCLDCAQTMRRDEVGRFLRMPCARNGGEVLSMKEARRRFAAPTADENFEEWRRDHNEFAPEYGWHEINFLPPLGKISTKERQQTRITCSLCGRSTLYGTRSRWEGDMADLCQRQRRSSAARRPREAAQSDMPPAKHRRSVPGVPVAGAAAGGRSEGASSSSAAVADQRQPRSPTPTRPAPQGAAPPAKRRRSVSGGVPAAAAATGGSAQAAPRRPAQRGAGQARGRGRGRGRSRGRLQG